MEAGPQGSGRSLRLPHCQFIFQLLVEAELTMSLGDLASDCPLRQNCLIDGRIGREELCQPG